MKCPYCTHLGDKVVDSRESKEGDVIRRRRECLECGRRFTSYERIDEIPSDRMTILYCNTGSLSAQATFALRVAGRANVVVLQSGISGWQQNAAYKP